MWTTDLPTVFTSPILKSVDWIISAISSAVGIAQRERERGRVVVEGESGWPAANPYTITGPSIAWVKVTNRTTQPIEVHGVGFLVGRRSIPVLGNSTAGMPAYLPPGKSVQSFCSLADLATVSGISGLTGAYAHVSGMPTVRAKVNPRRLFYPLWRETRAA
jgi:hypothetical protein